MGHIVLLGDSVFDNRAYTGSEPDVITHLRSVIPPGWNATLCAVDGATTSGLPSQIRALPLCGFSPAPCSPKGLRYERSRVALREITCDARSAGL